MFQNIRMKKARKRLDLYCRAMLPSGYVEAASLPGLAASVSPCLGHGTADFLAPRKKKMSK